MKKVLLIGNRLSCLKSLEHNPKYQLVSIFATKGSLLDEYLSQNYKSYTTFTVKEKEEVLKQLFCQDYDILVSNGCPIILPASKLMQQGKILLNTHPTFLPHLRGSTPLNGIFYNNYNFIGATTHYISDKIDAGNIIYQEKVDITEDIDQGLIYHISFKLEEIVFEKALSLLEENDYLFEGNKIDVSNGCYFNRTIEKQTLDLKNNDIETCIRKIKSFGIRTQGCYATIDGESYKFFSCERIFNPFLINCYNSSPTGKIVLQYDDCMIIKLKDGLLKITKYEKV